MAVFNFKFANLKISERTSWKTKQLKVRLNSVTQSSNTEHWKNRNSRKFALITSEAEIAQLGER